MLTKVGASGEFFGAGVSPRAGLCRYVDVFHLTAWHRNLSPVFAQTADVESNGLANFRLHFRHGVPCGNTKGDSTQWTLTSSTMLNRLRKEIS